MAAAVRGRGRQREQEGEDQEKGDRDRRREGWGFHWRKEKRRRRMASGWRKSQAESEGKDPLSRASRKFVLAAERETAEEAIDDPCWICACSDRDERVLEDSPSYLRSYTFQYLCLPGWCRAPAVAMMSQRILGWRTVLRDRHRGQTHWPG